MFGGNFILFVEIKRAMVYNLLVTERVDIMKHLIETHCHTQETSNCAHMPAEKVVKLYVSMGYDGLVISDHLHAYTFKRKILNENPQATWEEKVDCFLKGYKAALKEAENHPGFKVYLGCELRFDEFDNDYLIYGLSEEKLRDMKDIHEKETYEGFKILEEHGCSIIQAHPFRDDMTIVEPGHYDGVEVHNGHPGHDSRNDIAFEWAKHFDYIMTSGSDFHGEHKPNSGIFVDELPEDEEELRQLILSRNFSLKTI